MADKLEINYAIPMGLRCPVAFFLKQAGLKKTSYPFDWFKMYDFDLILKSLDDDFEELLDKNKYVDSATTYGRGRHVGCGHSTLPRGENVFFHRDPRIDEHYEYLKRCVDRFRKVLKQQESKLFLVASNFILNKKEFDVGVVNLNQKLSQITQNYYILAMTHKQNSPKHSVQMSRTDNMIFLDFNMFGGMNKKYSQLKSKRDRGYEKQKILELFDFNLLDG